MSDPEKMSKLRKFYKGKSKSSSLISYDYDDNGNLIQLKNGQVVETIPLPSYRSLTLHEITERDDVRKVMIQEATKQFDEARVALYHEYQNPEKSDDLLYRLNDAVKQADLLLQEVRFPHRFVDKEMGIKIRQMDFSQPNEARTYPYRIAMLKTSFFTLDNQYVREGEPSDKPFISIAEARQSNNVIIFNNAQPNSENYGFLSLNWPVDISIDGKVYHSARQAVYAQVADSFGDAEHAQEIRNAPDAESIQYRLEDIPGDKEAHAAKWANELEEKILNVNFEKFSQYPELLQRLLDTREAKLGAFEPDDTLIGIGIEPSNSRSKIPAYWPGKNFIGESLMMIRTAFQEQQQEQQLKMETGKKKRSTKKVRSSVPKASFEVPSTLITSASKAPSVTQVPSVTQAPVRAPLPNNPPEVEEAFDEFLSQ